MNRLLTSTVCCVACIAMTSVADAQFVRVGPFGGVSVRAPFVSIDAIPGGGARVRAPFTSVNTGVFSYGYGAAYRPYRYGYYRPYGIYGSAPVYPVYPSRPYTVPVYPQVEYPATSSVYPQSGQYQAARPQTGGSIPERLRASAQQLKQSLSMRRDDADVWINYLDPDRIIEAIDTAAAPNSLRELLLNYEGVVGNGTFGSIVSARGFGETYRLLREFVDTTPAESSVPSVPPADDANSVLVPTQPEAEEPTPAAAVKPADADEKRDVEKKSEELPLPTPTPL